MELKVKMIDQNGELIIELTIQGDGVNAIEESAIRWGNTHNSMNNDITKQVHGYEIDGQFTELEGGE